MAGYYRPGPAFDPDDYWMESCEHDGPFVDVYTPWGGGGDQEPPPDVALCVDCARHRFYATLASAIDKGIPTQKEMGSWHPPQACYQAVTIARALRRSGVELGVYHREVRHEWRKGEVRQWCACGFDTGWQTDGSIIWGTKVLVAHIKEPWRKLAQLTSEPVVRTDRR